MAQTFDPTWDEDEVSDWIRSMGRSRVWQEYAIKAVESGLNGQTLANCDVTDLTDVGFNKIHAKTVYAMIHPEQESPARHNPMSSNSRSSGRRSTRNSISLSDDQKPDVDDVKKYIGIRLDLMPPGILHNVPSIRIFSKGAFPEQIDDTHVGERGSLLLTLRNEVSRGDMYDLRTKMKTFLQDIGCKRDEIKQIKIKPFVPEKWSKVLHHAYELDDPNALAGIVSTPGDPDRERQRERHQRRESRRSHPTPEGMPQKRVSRHRRSREMSDPIFEQERSHRKNYSMPWREDNGRRRSRSPNRRKSADALGGEEGALPQKRKNSENGHSRRRSSRNSPKRHSHSSRSEHPHRRSSRGSGDMGRKKRKSHSFRRDEVPAEAEGSGEENREADPPPAFSPPLSPVEPGSAGDEKEPTDFMQLRDPGVDDFFGQVASPQREQFPTSEKEHASMERLTDLRKALGRAERTLQDHVKTLRDQETEERQRIEEQCRKYLDAIKAWKRSSVSNLNNKVSNACTHLNAQLGVIQTNLSRVTKVHKRCFDTLFQGSYTSQEERETAILGWADKVDSISIPEITDVPYLSLKITEDVCDPAASPFQVKMEAKPPKSFAGDLFEDEDESKQSEMKSPELPAMGSPPIRRRRTRDDSFFNLPPSGALSPPPAESSSVGGILRRVSGMIGPLKTQLSGEQCVTFMDGGLANAHDVGVFMDIRARTKLKIDGFSFGTIGSCSRVKLNVFVRKGTFQDFEDESASWDHSGSVFIDQTRDLSAKPVSDTLHRFLLNDPIELDEDELLGVYLHSPNTNKLATIDINSQTCVRENEDLVVEEGAATSSSDAFTDFKPMLDRGFIFSGAINYTVDTVALG